MKRVIVSLMVILALICLTSISFAAEAAKPSLDTPTAKTEVGSSLETIMGKIVSINKAKSEIVVKDDESMTDKTFVVKKKDLNKLKKGKLVKVTLAPGSTNKVGSIEIVKPEPGKKEEKK
jgi:hypothetical protein